MNKNRQIKGLSFPVPVLKSTVSTLTWSHILRTYVYLCSGPWTTRSPVGTE